MAITPYQSFHDCTKDGKYLDSILALENDIAQITDSILARVDALSLSETELDQGADILAAILKKSPIREISTLDKLCELVGLPCFDTTEELDEARLSIYGFLLINGLLFVKNGSNNLKRIRALYRLLELDFGQLEARLGNAGPGFVIVVTSRTSLREVRAPNPNRAPTLAEIRTALHRPDVQESDVVFITDDQAVVSALSPDFTRADQREVVAVVAIRELIGVDISLDRAASISGITKDQINVDVFPIERVTPNQPTLLRLEKLGIRGEALSSLLFNTDLAARQSTQVLEFLSKTAQSLDRAADQVNRLIADAKLNRVQGLKATDRHVDNAISEYGRAQTIVNFRVHTIPDRTVIGKMRTKGLTDAEIQEILETRSDTNGIDLDLTQEQLLNSLASTINISGGTTFASNERINEVDDPIDTRNTRFAQTRAHLDGIKQQLARATLSPSSTQRLISVRNQINRAQQDLLETRQTFQTLLSSDDTDPRQNTGVRCFDSAGSIIWRRVDVNRTFNMGNQIDNFAVNSANQEPAFASMLGGFGRVVNMAHNSVFQVHTALQDKISPWLGKVEAFDSISYSILGNGVPDNSFIKCALGIDLSGALSLLDDLLAIAGAIVGVVLGALGAIVGILVDLISDLLCKPLELLGQLLGTLNDLPIPCVTLGDLFTLPIDIRTQLSSIQGIFKFQQALFRSQRTHTVNLRIITPQIGPRANSFNNSNCNDDIMGSFLKNAGDAFGAGTDRVGDLITKTANLPTNAVSSVTESANGINLPTFP